MRINLMAITRLILTRPFIKRFVAACDEAIQHELSMLSIKGGAIVLGVVFVFRIGG